MAKKYLTPEEQQEVIKMYQTTKYSYQQIADNFYVSKGTIINVVKGYPYNCDKQAVYSRLQQEAKGNLDDCITREIKKAQEANRRGSMTAYSLHLERLKELYKYQVQDNIYEPIKQRRLQCEQTAWQGLADSNYIEFATNADMWEILTEIIGDSRKSPFKIMIQDSNARHKSKSVRYSNLIPHTVFNSRTVDYTRISDDSWQLISRVLPEHKPFRGKQYAGDRSYFNAIYNSITTGSSWRLSGKKYKLDPDNLRKAFIRWYQAGIFKDLLELCSVCRKLQAIEPQLIELERIRQEKGTVPRMKDLQSNKISPGDC
ncbi:hypothetical protein Cpap_1502 [Ruminiclostridium papyrosolvens DSM 2782]|uniref:Insertion element IS402-like domain-containing protein n=1 Tax=Ruminiclostridium papyrosolvens DSM 2782 TaxID=588581 RepID=F1TEE4_9FIRM|nr:transposase [Ruminiclostridium papyrosolvens]EGD47110.1 hypothetical protein Cpap_1502 [Ruminiclostridium papyrosolvens DSM 2782]WES36053.1 transposase [Ruminiclostridium papyrosolvens DSM 2782]WES36151.1 transposase [Ruminiclostridium papyrosolvens DSM 2782]